MKERILSIDAPILLPLSPPSNLSRTEETPEDIVMYAHRALEEAHDIVAGILIDTASFFAYGSLGFAALEAIFDMVRELDIPLIVDAPDCFSVRAATSIRRSFCEEDGVFFCDAVRSSCRAAELSDILCDQEHTAIFLTTDHEYMCASPSNNKIRENHPDAFLLIDGLSMSKHFRRADGGGVLHVARNAEEHIWGEKKEGALRASLIDCAKDFRSLA
jgi:hypothetical protein